MRLLLTLALLALSAVSGHVHHHHNATLVKSSVSVPVPYKSCASNGVYDLVSVEASSWPPKAGGPVVTLTQTVNLKKDVTEGSVKTVTKYLGITVQTTNDDLCATLGCPKTAGTYTISSDLPEVPKLSGSISSTAQIIIGGETAGCWEVTFNL